VRPTLQLSDPTASARCPTARRKCGWGWEYGNEYRVGSPPLILENFADCFFRAEFNQSYRYYFPYLSRCGFKQKATRYTSRKMLLTCGDWLTDVLSGAKERSVIIQLFRSYDLYNTNEILFVKRL